MHNNDIQSTVEFARKVAAEVHKGEVRRFSGNPYITHCDDVYALCLMAGETDEQVLAAALLHDVIESVYETGGFTSYSNYSLGILNNFGSRVQKIVLDLTLLNGLETSKDEYLGNIARAGGDVLFIKACDRICNVEDFLKEDKKYAKKYYEKANVIWEACKKAGERFSFINKRAAELAEIMGIEKIS